MRISDWSSDVCSSDLPTEAAQLETFRRLAFGPGAPVPGRDHLAKWQQPIRAAFVDAPGDSERQAARQHLHDLAGIPGIEITEASPASAHLLVSSPPTPSHRPGIPAAYPPPPPPPPPFPQSPP